jgi:hypothetical protein
LVLREFAITSPTFENFSLPPPPEGWQKRKRDKKLDPKTKWFLNKKKRTQIKKKDKENGHTHDNCCKKWTETLKIVKKMGQNVDKITVKNTSKIVQRTKN